MGLLVERWKVRMNDTLIFNNGMALGIVEGDCVGLFLLILGGSVSSLEILRDR